MGLMVNESKLKKYRLGSASISEILIKQEVKS
jgi:hypothetical protein